MSYDWSAVGYASHPIPGDPAKVLDYAVYYERVAEAIQDTATNLRATVDATQTESEAIAAFRDLATKVAESVSEIDGRYTAVASAMRTYEAELDRTRSQALAQLSVAGEALEDRQNAITREYRYRDQLEDPNTPPANIPYIQHKLNVAESDQTDATVRIQSAKDAIERLIDERATAANAAANAIRNVIDGSDLNDSWWDKVADFAATVWNLYLDALEVLMDVLDVLLPILDILSLILTIVAIVLILTGVGAAIGAALLTVARVINLISLALKAVKFMATALLVVGGRRSLADLALAGIDLALSAFTFGKGGSIVKTAADATKAAAKEAIVDYLVTERLEEFVADELEIIVEMIDTGEPPSIGEIARDLLLTDTEWTIVQIVDEPASIVTGDYDGELDGNLSSPLGAAAVIANPAIVPIQAGAALIDQVMPVDVSVEIDLRFSVSVGN